MFETEDVVQKTLAQAAVVVTDKSRHHSDQLSGQSSSSPVIMKQTGGSGQTTMDAPMPKRKKEMAANIDLETKQNIAW